MKRTILILLLCALPLTGCTSEEEYVAEEGCSSPECGGEQSTPACLDLLPELPIPREVEPGCWADGLDALVGEWVNHQGEAVTIDDDLVMNGDTTICVDGHNLLQLTHSTGDSVDPYTQTLRTPWRSTEDLLAWNVWQRATDCGEGPVGRWRTSWRSYGSQEGAGGREDELILYPDGRPRYWQVSL